jgi:hypothetical protein
VSRDAITAKEQKRRAALGGRLPIARAAADFKIEVTPGGGAYFMARADDGTLWQFNWLRAEWLRVPALPGTGDEYETLQPAPK